MKYKRHKRYCGIPITDKVPASSAKRFSNCSSECFPIRGITIARDQSVKPRLRAAVLTNSARYAG